MLKTLADATKRIHKLEESSIKNMHAIANTLKEVKANGLDTASGYSDVHDYAEKELQYKKSTSYMLVQVAERFLTDKNESILKRKDEKDYTVSQLRELCPLTNEIINELIEAGEISPQVSTRKLNQIVKGYKTLEDKNNKKQQEASEEQQEASEEQKDYVEFSREWIVSIMSQIKVAFNMINDGNVNDDVNMISDNLHIGRQLCDLVLKEIDNF